MNTRDKRTESAGPHKPAGRKPDFFIIGAPKAGTTSLYTYLAEHPRIFMPSMKEPFYFCDDMPLYREKATLVPNMTTYLELFAPATDEHLTCGEASPLYLFSKVAAPNILAFNADARFIVMLRNPVDLVHSFHSQLVFGLHEAVADFEQAWRLQQARAEGRRVPKDCLAPQLLQYRQVGMLGAQLARLLTHVCPTRVKVLLFDDFAADPRSQYEDVLAFLGVPSDHRSEFPRENANKLRRSRTIARWLRRPPFPLNVVRRQYLRRFGADSWAVRYPASLNRKPAQRTPLTTDMRRELEGDFHDDVRLLEHLVPRDLSNWIPARPKRGQARRAG